MLNQEKDRYSLQAVMQTSRELQMVASSFISSIEIHDAFALAHYPKHAAAIISVRLWMRPSHPVETHMEPPCMVTCWLRSTSAVSNRLAAVACVRVVLPQPSMEDTMEPAVMDSLLASIGQACPNLRCLCMDGIDRRDEELVCSMFTAIGQRLPGIIELQLDLDEGEYWDTYNWPNTGIDWAACLPRGLQKFTSNAHLHHELLQHLVQMPSLTEVAVRPSAGAPKREQSLLETPGDG